MVFINVVVDCIISCRSFVFSQSRAKVSDGVTDIRNLRWTRFRGDGDGTGRSSLEQR